MTRTREPRTLATSAQAARALLEGRPVWALDCAGYADGLYLGTEAEVRRDIEEWTGEALPTDWSLFRVEVRP